MYMPENSTNISRIPANINSDLTTKTRSDLYILFAFMGFVMGSFMLFFTVNVSKARLGARKITPAVIDLPPRYSDVVPPSYEWVLEQLYPKEHRLKGYAVSNLSSMIVICNCLLTLLQYC